MERIGIAASKMAQGNFFLYNFYVILLSFLLALLIFLIGGSAVMIALIVIGYFAGGVGPAHLEDEWRSVIFACLGALSFFVGLSTLAAILRNAKLHK